VEEGLAAFNERKDYAEALRLFKAAMALKPSEPEAIAALYNAGCAHAKRKEYKEAAAAILSAVNDYNLKLSVALAVRGARGGAAPPRRRRVARVLCCAAPRRAAPCTWPPRARGAHRRALPLPHGPRPN
jgi:tetratricopeptide (TPR) repeat protein